MTRILKFIGISIFMIITNAYMALANPSTPANSGRRIEYKSFTSFPGVGRISTLCELTDALWQLGIVVLIISVFGVLVYAGFTYVTAGINVNGVSEAKRRFASAITGLILGLSSVIILSILDVNLLTPTCTLQFVGSGTNPFNNITFGTPGTSVPGNRNCDGCVLLTSRGVTIASGFIHEGANARAMPQVVDAWKRVQDRMAADGIPIFATAAYAPGTGHSAGSQHYLGLAIDGQPIAGSSRTQRVLQNMANYCKQEGFTFVMTYPGGWVHCDMR
jgi:hypothetical protein